MTTVLGGVRAQGVDELEAEIMALRQGQALLLQAAEQHGHDSDDRVGRRGPEPFARHLRRLAEELGFRAEQHLRWRHELERQARVW